jgi:two-component system, NtrC family, response regulator HydG
MATHQPQLLIVDDEVDACQNLSDILTDMGYGVDIAHDGPSALELVRKKTYDVALLDLKMPGMDGVELYKRIKAVSAETIAIVVTAFAGSKIAQAARDAGVAEVIAKPVDFQKLLRHVEETLDQPLVMVVDDDPDLCDSLWEILRQHHYRVGIAHNVPDADAKLRDHDYQVVLIDMKLPAGSGTEVFRLVRQTHSQARTILITGFQTETEQQVADVLAEGADAVAYKPFDVDLLLKTLSRLTKANGTT